MLRATTSTDMKQVDMRKLAPAAQEERRRQVIGLRQNGVSYAAIAAQVGLSQTGVFDICKRFAAKGKMRWYPWFGQFGGLAKLGSGCYQAANFSVPVARYASSGVRPA